MVLPAFAVRTFCPCAKYIFDPLLKFCKLSEYSSTCINKFRYQGLSSSIGTKPIDKEVENVQEPQRESKSKGRKSVKTDKSSDTDLKSITPTAKTIFEYIGLHGELQEEEPNLIKLLPKQCLKLSKSDPTLFYLINKSAAKTFANAIKSVAPNTSSPVLELHPGVGFLTAELVNTVGFKYMSCLEDSAEVGKYLKCKYSVTTIDCSTSDLPRHHHLDKHDGGGRIHTILSKINIGGSSAVKDECLKRLYVIGAEPNIDEFPWDGVTLFLALGSKVHTICTAVPDSGLVAYRPTSIFFQTLFKFKKIGVLPRAAFIPWETNDTVERKGPKSRKLNVDNPDILTIVRVDVRQDALNLIGRDNLFSYWYFVRQHLYARTNRIIPELERWCPECGPRLIKQGFDIYSIFGKLCPEEIFNLYLQFVSWPEFSNSSFLNAVEKFQARVEMSEDDDH